jgi:outer membrane biosynthesis protein TonB
MEYVTPLLLVIVLGAVAFLILKSGRPAEAGADPANAALLEEALALLETDADAAPAKDPAPKSEAAPRTRKAPAPPPAAPPGPVLCWPDPGQP